MTKEEYMRSTKIESVAEAKKYLDIFLGLDAFGAICVVLIAGSYLFEILKPTFLIVFILLLLAYIYTLYVHTQAGLALNYKRLIDDPYYFYKLKGRNSDYSIITTRLKIITGEEAPPVSLQTERDAQSALELEEAKKVQTFSGFAKKFITIIIIFLLIVAVLIFVAG